MCCRRGLLHSVQTSSALHLEQSFIVEHSESSKYNVCYAASVKTLSYEAILWGENH